MRSCLFYFITLIIVVSCGSSGGKKLPDTQHRMYMILIKDVDGYNVAYTENGHTLICRNDSSNNIIVYYAKFENNAGKYWLKGIDEKIIRVEMDSSINILKSILSFTGGAFCEMNETGYSTYYFDEKMKEAHIENLEIPMDSGQLENSFVEYNMKRIIAFLNVAYKVAYCISENKVSGWDNIAFSLEPVHEILSCDIIVSNTLQDTRTNKHILRMVKVAEELNFNYGEFREKMISKRKHSLKYTL